MLRWVLASISALALAGCYQSHRLVYEGPRDAGPSRDAGPPIDAAPLDAGRDSGVRDAGRRDSGVRDAGPFDAGRRDSGVRDAGPFDAGRRDSGVRDAGPFDAGRRDSGVRDAGPFDAGRRDSGVRDAGPFDAGRRDSGPRDSGPRDSGPRDAGPPDTGPRDSGPPRPALRTSRTTFFGVGDAPSFDLAGDSTFELWVRSRELGDIDYCGKGDTMARDLIVGQRGGVFVIGWRVGLNRYFVEGSMVPFDTWTHIAVVRRLDASGAGHTVELYVDGALVGTATHPQLVDAFNDRPFRCGFVDADIDEIRLWRVARNAVDIAANRAVRVSGGIPGLVSYWRLDESGQILLDYTAMGRVGILGLLTTPDAADATWISDGAL